MTESPTERRRADVAVTAAAVVVVVAGLRAAAPLLRPLLLALFLATLSLPLMRWLQARGWPVGLAVAATVLADMALLIGFAVAVGGAVNGFAQVAPGYLEQLSGMIGSGVESLRARGGSLAEWIQVERLELRQLVDLAGGLVGRSVKGVASAVSYLTVLLVALIFLLVEMADFPAKMLRLVGRDTAPSRYFQAISREFQRYLGVKTLVSLGTGLLAGLWVALLGVEFALLWGLIAFLLNYIPVLGSILAAVPAVLFTVVEQGAGRALLVLVGYLLINLLIGNLLEPHLMGRRFGLSPLAVFLAVIFWAWVLGPLGMILAVPLTMVIKIAIDYSQRLRWLGVLLEPASPGPRS